MGRVLSHTDCVKYDKYFRLMSTIRARRQYMSDRLNGLKGYKRVCVDYQVFNDFVEMCDDACDRLDEFISITNSIDFDWIEKSYKRIYDWYKTWPSTRQEHVLQLLGIESSKAFGNTDHQWFLDFLSGMKKKADRFNLQSRIAMELARANVDKWAVVFNTLTVSPEYYYDVFIKGSNLWRNYIRSIDRAVAESVFGSYRKRDGSDYFNYCAIVEHGGTTGRLHIHVVMSMRKLPRGCVDPNKGLRDPYKQEISKFNQYWKYGTSTPLAVRFHANDYYGELLWRWPVDSDTNRPVEATTPGRLGCYLTKYFTKNFGGSTMKGDKIWRTRLNSGFGLIEIRRALETLQMDQIKSIVANRMCNQRLMCHGTIIPYNLVRKQAVRRYIFYLKKKGEPLTSSNLPPNRILKELLRSTTVRKQNFNRQSSGSLMMQILNASVVYKGSTETFVRSIRQIRDFFDRGLPISFVSTGGTLICRT